MLTAEFCEGCKVNDVEAIKTMGLAVQDVAAKLIQAFAEQIFYTGFIHSDPHPGNGKTALGGGSDQGPGRSGVSPHAVSLVLVRKGLDGKAELVLLDHGLYQFLDEK